jgi:GAF domain-containing protein
MAGSHELMAAAAELATVRLADHGLDGVLDRVVHLTVRTVEGAGEASITLLRDGRPHTAAYTGKLALDLDEWQYREGRGPCLEAATERTAVVAADLTTDIRWFGWTAHAVAAGARSAMSIGLASHDRSLGSLNIYGRTAGALDDAALAAFAGDATIALSNALLYAEATSAAEHLRSAMDSRAVIEQAKGIIMATNRCTADQAFALLVQASQKLNRKVREIAAAMVSDIGGPGAH